MHSSGFPVAKYLRPIMQALNTVPGIHKLSAAHNTCFKQATFASEYCIELYINVR